MLGLLIACDMDTLVLIEVSVANCRDCCTVVGLVVLACMTISTPYYINLFMMMFFFAVNKFQTTKKQLLFSKFVTLQSVNLHQLHTSSQMAFY